MARYSTKLENKEYYFRNSEIVVIQKPKLIWDQVGCVDETLETAQEILEKRLGFSPATEEQPYIPHPNVKKSLPKTGHIYVKKIKDGFIQAEINEQSKRISKRCEIRGIKLKGLEEDVHEIYNSLIQFPEIGETFVELGIAQRLPIYSCDNYPKKGEVLVLEAGEFIYPEGSSLVYLGGRFLWEHRTPELLTSTYVKINEKGFLVLAEINNYSFDYDKRLFYQRLKDFHLTPK